jgi:hypothetical protein
MYDLYSNQLDMGKQFSCKFVAIGFIFFLGICLLVNQPWKALVYRNCEH